MIPEDDLKLLSSMKLNPSARIPCLDKTEDWGFRADFAGWDVSMGLKIPVYSIARVAKGGSLEGAIEPGV